MASLSLLSRRVAVAARPTFASAFASRGLAAKAGLVDCSRIHVKRDSFGGHGAYAACDLKKGDFVEKGIARVIPTCGKENAFVFTWPVNGEMAFATGSGASVFYNTPLVGEGNTHFERNYEGEAFAVYATEDVKKGEELTHAYHGTDWRTCFFEIEKLRKAVADGTMKDEKPPIPDPSEHLVNMDRVYVKYDEAGEIGVYASEPIKEGELVECGVARREPVDGNECPLVYQWSEDGSVWAVLHGAATFYKPGLKGTANCRVVRNWDTPDNQKDLFQIYATRDIAQDEELTHLYMGLDTRPCFAELKKAHG